METTEHIHTADCDHGSEGSCGANISEPERLASLIAGGLLALFGLSRRSWIGVVIALLGGGLLYRGVTRHCCMYAKLGISTAEEDYDAYYDNDNEDSDE